jgi:hypothetical protein
MIAVALLSALICLFPRGGMAQGSGEGAWQNNLFLYGWTAGVTGTARLGPLETPIDVEFSEILDRLAGGVMTRYRGASERFAVVGDLIYLKLEESRDDGVLRRAELEQLVVDLTGAYRVTPILEAFGGLRVTDVETQVDLGLPSFPEAGTTERRRSETFYDPIVGARLVTPLGANRRLWVQAQGDVGGFGVGMDFTWQATGHVGFRVVDWFSFWGGYRALGMDFDQAGARGSYGQDIVLRGFSFAAGFHF